MRGLLRVAAAALFICAAPALTACGTPTGPAPAVTAAQVGQRAMLAAEAAFNAAATAELNAKAVGLLKGDKAARADQIRREAYQALLAMRAAYAVGRDPNPFALMALTKQLLILSGQPSAALPQPGSR